MNRYVCSLILLSAGCFHDPGDNLTSGQTETDDSTSESSGSADDGADDEGSDAGGSETDSGSSEPDDGATETDDSTTTASDETETSSTAETSDSTGVTPPCPDGAAFNQGYCWLIAECDPELCTYEGGWECKSNVETCGEHGLDPTAATIVLAEWSEAVAQDLVDQLGLFGVEAMGPGSAFGMWNSELNTLGAWGYGMDVEYSNPGICTEYGDYVYWPIHTCFPQG